MEQLISQTRAGNLEAVKEILEQNPELNLSEAVNERKVLADALETENSDILKTYLESGRIDLNQWIFGYDKPLQHGQDCYSFKCIKRLRNRAQDHRISPLFFAIEIGSSSKLELFAKYGADLQNSRTPKSDLTPLMYACLLKDFELVKSILKNSADYNVTNKFGKTALDYFFEPKPKRDFWFSLDGERKEAEANKAPRKMETIELAAFLYHYGRVFLSNDNGTLLIKFLNNAIKNNCQTFGFANRLVQDCKFKLDQPDQAHNNMTPLMLAMKSNSFATIKLLIQAGANMNAKNSRGKSVFIHFCENWPVNDFTDLFKEFKITVNDCLDYLKLCDRKRIQILQAILGRNALFWPFVQAVLYNQWLEHFLCNV